MSTDIPDRLHAILDECGYQQAQIKAGRVVCVAPFLFTWAILADVDQTGYAERWCFHTLQDATGALADWDGTGDPEGWHKHIPSGRRRDDHGNDLGVW